MNKFLKTFGFDISLWDEETKKILYKETIRHLPIWILVIRLLTGFYFWLKFSKIKISQKYMSDKHGDSYVIFPSRQKITIKSNLGESTYDIWVNKDRDFIINGISHSVDSQKREILPVILN